MLKKPFYIYGTNADITSKRGRNPKIKENILLFFDETTKKHGSFVEINIPTRKSYVINDPDIAKQILTKPRLFIKGRSIKTFRDVLFAKNIHVGQMVSEIECEPTNAYGVLFSTGKSTDSTPEEMNHFVMGEGAAFAYPKVFGMKFGANSELTKALDNAR